MEPVTAAVAWQYSPDMYPVGTTSWAGQVKNCLHNCIMVYSHGRLTIHMGWHIQWLTYTAVDKFHIDLLHAPRAGGPRACKTLSGPTPHAVNVLLLWLIRTMKFSGFLPVFYRIFRILHFGKFSIEKTQRACKSFASPVSFFNGKFSIMENPENPVKNRKILTCG